ncbi:MAG: FMN-binding protein [Eubacterium sp.]|jgi:electron transport complex protein RnfG|nr:FMN-binding protein [Eubacterium sp.]
MANVKPTLILTVITAVIAALLIVASTVWPEPTGLTETLKEKCVSLAGEGEYMIASNLTGYEAVQSENAIIKNIINNDKKDIIFEVVANGYVKGGLDVLIAMDVNGSVKGIEIVELKETPGLGTKVNDPVFIEKFIGLSEQAQIVKTAPKNDTEVQAITGATYSSKGMADAVNLAIETYKVLEVKE